MLMESAVHAPTRRRPKSLKIYFVAQFDRPIENLGGWQDGNVIESAGPFALTAPPASEFRELILPLSGAPALVSANAVSLFLLPEAVGGMLEVSRDLVSSIIQRAAAAGFPTQEATRFLTRAQIAIANGEYKRGYLNLARAYNAVMILTPAGL